MPLCAWLVGAGRQRVPDDANDKHPFAVFVDGASGRAALDVRRVDGLWCAVAHGNLAGIGRPGRSASEGPLVDGDELWMSGRSSLRFRLVDDDDPLPFRERRGAWLLFDETWATARGARGSALHLESGLLLSTTRSLIPLRRALAGASPPPTLATRHASISPHFVISRAAGVDVDALLRAAAAQQSSGRPRPPARIAKAIRQALVGLGDVDDALFPADLVATFDGRFVATAFGPPERSGVGRAAFEALLAGAADEPDADVDEVAGFVASLFPLETARDALLREQLELLDEAGRMALVPPWCPAPG